MSLANSVASSMRTIPKYLLSPTTDPSSLSLCSLPYASGHPSTPKPSLSLSLSLRPTFLPSHSLSRSPLRLRSNGDSYSGTAPHSSGKYTWSDGCTYAGKPSGTGNFSWPSGATFRSGDFRSGRMSGSGTFTAPSGDTYRGSYGSKSYSNGDFYEGSWRGNLQDGHGRYVWRNGNQYVGEWRSGVISGRGVLVWANGNRYDGHWENGVPKGSGVFTWPDGSCYVGCWSKLTGTFYPATAPADSGRRRIHSASSDDGKLSIYKNFSKICIWESDGEAGDITCDIVDTLQAYKERPSFEEEEERRRPCCFPAGEAKKPGQTISKGHKNYDLMLNLQLGIRYTVGKPASIKMRELRSGDFDPGEKFWTRFPPEGSKVTPPHQSAEFRWKDYCPMVFRHLRKLFAVDPGDYMMAICGNGALRELSSPGKSGSFFYLTQDDRFMIKTVKKSEAKVLIRMLPSYYRHVHKYTNSLVTKFFGVHCVKPIGGQKVRFVVIGNFFCSDYRINRRFDLKGSSYGRTTEKTEGEMDETTTLKDLDLNLVFRLQTFWFKELIKQIGRDCEFLEAEGIMDYSLLVGVHFCEDVSTSMRLSRSDLSRKPVVRLGSNLPARAQEVSRRSPSLSEKGETYNVILYFGIIDVLQDYDISKKLEHAYKSLQVDPASISAVGPKLYARRFRDFIDSIFIEDD